MTSHGWLVRVANLPLFAALAAAQITVEPGWPVTTGFSVSPSATAAQLDGDAELEIVIASQDNKVYALNHDGTPVPGWPRQMGSAMYPDQWLRFNSSPAVGDIDGDGYPEIVVGGLDGKVWAWNHDGSLVPGWPYNTGYMVASTPSLGDIDGDGALEIVIGNHYGRVYAFNGNGTLCSGFPRETGYAIRGSPALGDLDEDGYPEIVVPSEVSGPDLWAFDGNGANLPGFPLDLHPGLGIESSPALGDIDQDGHLDIVIGLRNGLMYALNRDGSVKFGWPYNAGYTFESSPALANLDDDPELEIVCGANNSQVIALNHDGSLLPGWPVATSYSVLSSPAIGDVDGDGELDIVIGENTGKVYGFHVDGTAIAGFPLFTTYTVYSTPLLADLDLDGHLELLVGCNDSKIYCWDLGPESLNRCALPWPQWRCDAANTALAVVSTAARGDLNCDGLVDFGDINPFVLALSDPAGYAAAFHDCDLMNGDCNCDGLVDFDDISAFVALMSGG